MSLKVPGESPGGGARSCASNLGRCAFRAKRGYPFAARPRTRPFAGRKSIRGRKWRGDAGSCGDFHAGEIDFLRGFRPLRPAPRFKVKLHRFGKVLLGDDQGPALGRYRHVQAPRNEPLAIILKNSMNRSHTLPLCNRRAALARWFPGKPLVPFGHFRFMKNLTRAAALPPGPYWLRAWRGRCRRPRPPTPRW